MYVYELSQDNIAIGFAEIQELIDSKAKKDHHLVLSSKKKHHERIAYCHKTCELINTSTTPKQIEKRSAISYKIEFCYKTTDEEREKWFKAIYQSYTHPKINLSKPQETICIFKTKKYYVTKLITEQNKEYLKRTPHTRPMLHPSAMKPRLARAMINLAGDVKTIYDPCCGTGGTLIEALHLGLSGVGSDISTSMIESAQQNIESEQIKNKHVKLFLADATTVVMKPIQSRAIVSDLPYGKNTKKIPTDLYANLIKHFLEISPKVVVCLPHYANPSKIFKKIPCKMTQHLKEYMHKSLTREIFVIERLV